MGVFFPKSAKISCAARRCAPVGAKGSAFQKGDRSAGRMGAPVCAASRLRSSSRPSCSARSSSKISRRRAACTSCRLWGK